MQFLPVRYVLLLVCVCCVLFSFNGLLFAVVSFFLFRFSRAAMVAHWTAALDVFHFFCPSVAQTFRSCLFSTKCARQPSCEDGAFPFTALIKRVQMVRRILRAALQQASHVNNLYSCVFFTCAVLFVRLSESDKEKNIIKQTECSSGGCRPLLRMLKAMRQHLRECVREGVLSATFSHWLTSWHSKRNSDSLFFFSPLLFFWFVWLAISSAPRCVRNRP